MTKFQSYILLGVALVLLVGIAVVLGNQKATQTPEERREDGENEITSFEECTAAGNPIMESYPEQCRTEDGRTFVRDISNDPPVQDILENPAPGRPAASGGCYVGGCSGQICSDDPEAVSDCQFREVYACYQTATCARQSSGACGWTDSAELRACLASAE